MSKSNNKLTKLVAPDSEENQRKFTQMIARMVEEQVQEALSGDKESIFQPFFQTKEIAREIKRRQTVPEQQKWHFYFEKHGCLICGTKEKAHHHLGMCATCLRRTYQRLAQIIREHTPETQQSYVDTMQLARAALAPSIEILSEETAIISPAKASASVTALLPEKTERSKRRKS
jgi:hypothetical protein